MKLALTLGVAFTAITLAAATADTTHTRTIIRHGGGAELNLDTDNDGWLTRAEASAAADRAFDQLDSNGDGRLTGDDRPAREHARFIAPDIDVDIDLADGDGAVWVDEENGERRIIIRRGEDLSAEDEARIEREVERAMEQAERAQASAERAQAAAERAAARAEARADRASRDAIRRAREAARDGERHVQRDVVVIRANGDEAIAPHAPHPPRPPMFMMLVANSDEADTNGDGAISREEFRAQHLRFFDASDANGDGRVRFEAPAAPPVAPAAPTPPAPPTPPRR